MAKEKEITVIMSLHEIDLAQKISDKVVCVKGDRIAGFGNPEEIFTEAKIRELYGIDNGYYDPCFGSVELPRVVGNRKFRPLILWNRNSGLPETSESRNPICCRNPISGRVRLSARKTARIRDHQ